MKLIFIPFDDNNAEHWYESLAEWQGGDYERYMWELEEEMSHDEQIGVIP